MTATQKRKSPVSRSRLKTTEKTTKNPSTTSFPPVKKVCPMEVRRSYTFQFPRHNFHGILSRLEKRRIKVESIRDLVADPIEYITFEVQPLLRRGRFLVTGLDLDKNKERSFYFESMKGIVEIESPQADRKVLTGYVVAETLFVEENQAEAAAQAEVSFTGVSTSIEKIEISTDVPRTLFRVVQSKRKGKSRLRTS